LLATITVIGALSRDWSAEDLYYVSHDILRALLDKYYYYSIADNIIANLV